jgi:hypothetical protein
MATPTILTSREKISEQEEELKEMNLFEPGCSELVFGV